MWPLCASGDISSYMSLEDSLVSCESEVLLRSYESDLLLHISERKCALCVCGSSISHGVPSLQKMVPGPLVFLPRAQRKTPGLAS